MIKYISFDPGETTGVVCWDAEGNHIQVGQHKEKELDKFLLELPDPKEIDTFIIEEYRVYGHVRHTGSKVQTIQVIGALKAYARYHSIKIVEQPATILKIAQMWSGTEIPKDHKISHWASAYNHGYYYLHRQGIIKARVLNEQSTEQS